jgi:acyl carrier protein
MDLEADLGVDSIKRVEILSAVREAEPGLPEVDAGELANLQTLGQIVTHLGAALPAAGAVPVAAGSSSIDLPALLISVVSDKTGYPAEMLSLEMDLEADLGVDSIKRVEILSAVREAEPGLPEVDAGELANLQTLG